GTTEATPAVERDRPRDGVFIDEVAEPTQQRDQLSGRQHVHEHEYADLLAHTIAQRGIAGGLEVFIQCGEVRVLGGKSFGIELEPRFISRELFDCPTGEKPHPQACGDLSPAIELACSNVAQYTQSVTSIRRKEIQHLQSPLEYPHGHDVRVCIVVDTGL